MERKVVSRFKDSDGEMRDYELPLPVAMVMAKPKKKGGAKGGAKKGSKAKKKTVDDPEAKLRKRLVTMAKKFDEDDHEDFVEAAIDKHGEALEEFDELHVDVLDDEGEIWEEAHE